MNVRIEDRNGIVSRPEDQRSAGRNNDEDIILHGPGGPFVDTGSSIPLPVGMLDAAREFGHRGDRDGFRRFLSGCSSDTRNWQRLQAEYEQAAAGEELQAWQRVWRYGISVQLSTACLEALHKALLYDDPRVIQTGTTSPPPLMCTQGWPCEGADPVAYACWQGLGLDRVSEVEEAFARICMKADQLLGEPACIKYFCNFWDEGDRDTVRKALLAEVALCLPQKAAEAKTPLAAAV
jgi:hypothetical protein